MFVSLAPREDHDQNPHSMRGGGEGPSATIIGRRGVSNLLTLRHHTQKLERNGDNEVGMHHYIYCIVIPRLVRTVGAEGNEIKETPTTLQPPPLAVAKEA